MQNKEILTAREYLNQAFDVEQKILDKTLDLCKLNSDILKCTQSYGDDPPKQHNDNSTEIKIHNYIDKCEKIKAEIIEEADALLVLKWEMRKKILQISEPKFQNVLIYRHWHCHKWSKVKAEMGYKDIRSVYRVHDKAVLAFIKKHGNSFSKICNNLATSNPDKSVI